jgi:hypothetical protein
VLFKSFRKFRYWAVILTAFILSLALTLPALAQGPDVTGTDPTTNTVDAPADTDISVTFDAALDTGTVDDTTFVAHGMHGGVLTGTYSFADGDTEDVTN